jgi:hypothetical protein
LDRFFPEYLLNSPLYFGGGAGKKELGKKGRSPGGAPLHLPGAGSGKSFILENA